MSVVRPRVAEAAGRTGGSVNDRPGAVRLPVAYLVLGLAFVLGLASALSALPGPDVSYLLFAADRLLDGARYGADVMEVNPPLIVWIYMLPAALARVLGVSAHVPLVVLTTLLIAATLVVLHGALEREPQRMPLLAAMGAGALLLPGVEFGQREHIAAVLALMWAAVTAARLGGARLGPRRAGAAFLGGIGFLLKPYFLLAWLAIECVVVRRHGWRALLRAENWILVSTGAAYVVVAWLTAPDFFDLAARLGPAYGAYLTQGHVEAALTVVGAGIFAWYRLRHPARSDALAILEAGAAGFVLAAAAQLKWWPYHMLPAMIFAFPCLAVARPLAWPDRHATSNLPGGVAQLVALYLLAGAVARDASLLLQPRDRSNLAEPYLLEMLAIIDPLPPGSSVMVLSTNIQSAWPLIPLSNAEWASRLPSLWPLMASYAGQVPDTGYVQYRPADRRDGIERWLNDVLYEDLVRSEPALIFVMRRDPVLNDSGNARRIDYVAYLKDDPRFADFLNRYRPGGSVGRYDVLIRSSP